MTLLPRRPRTVLIVTPSSRLLGARRSLLALVEALDEDRWRPVVCGQSVGQLGRALESLAIPMEVVRLGWWRKGKYFLWRPFAIARLAALARSVNADLIHCNEIYSNPYAVRAARNVPAPTDSPCAGGSVPVLTHVRLGMKRGMIRKYDLGRADGIIAPSRAVAREFDGWEEPAPRVHVVHNGVNMDEFHRTLSPDAARDRIGVPRDGLLLGAIGQLGPRKGGDLILDAFARLAPRHPNLRLIFVGDPHRGQEQFADDLKRRAAEPPLAGRVFFFPFTDQIIPYYEAIDVNLLISRKEGFGRTIIEASALGIPSIGAATGGIEEIIADGITGRLVPPDDPVALADAIGQLAANDSLRRMMADAAFRHCAQHFSIAAHARRIMDIYDETLEARGANL